MNKLVEQYIEEVYLTEDISSILAKLQSKKMAILSSLKTEDPGKVKAVLSTIPHLPVDKLHDLASKHIPGFQLEYDKAIRKQQGTPEERQIKALTMSIVYAIKKNVKIPEVRKSLEDVKVDPSYAFVARDIFSGLCLIGLAYLGYLGVGAAWSAITTAAIGVGVGITGFIGVILTIILGALFIFLSAGLIGAAGAVVIGH